MHNAPKVLQVPFISRTIYQEKKKIISSLANKTQPFSPERYIKLAITLFLNVKLLYFQSNPQLLYQRT